MTRDEALPYVMYAVDNALSERRVSETPDHARLVGWKFGNDRVFVAVWSYLGGRLDDDEAEGIAKDLLDEKGWFRGPPGHFDADYIL